ncbi:nucleotidyltransferase family protein [Streptomyces sp.]|uniref:nucleotidyltransferase family protein n=1 Tax=Streptomyces sp. TaxID=1931 RepID=UPI0039C93019
MAGGGRPDDATFVLDAVRSYALDTACPEPPPGGTWLAVAAQARVLPVILDHLALSGRPLPKGAGDWPYVGMATHLRSLVEIRAVQSAFAGTGVRWVVVKGVVLADIIYRRPSVRPYSDLDVLVHPADLGPALDALEAAHFEVVDRNWQLIADSGRGEISLRTPMNTTLDLHWHLLNEASIRAQFFLDVAAMVERRTTVDIDGLVVPTLRPDDTVVHLALHAALSGGHRLQWLLDLQQALRWSDLSVAEVAVTARRAGAVLAVQTMAARASQHVDPGLRSLVRRLGRPSPWTVAATVVSRRVPPLGTETGRRTGRLFFGATRSTTARSVAELVRASTAAGRRRVTNLDDSVDVSVLRTPAGDSVDRRRWVAAAAAAGASVSDT